MSYFSFSMANHNTLFTDSIPGEQRKFLRVFLEWLRTNGIERLHIPNVGEFAAAKVALEAGYTPEQIYTYDTSLYGSLLGHFYSGQALELLDFHITRPELREAYEQSTDEAEKLALIMFHLKLSQLRSYVSTDKAVTAQLKSKQAHYVSQIQQQLTAFKEQVYGGINFERKDLREVITSPDYTDKETVVVHVPSNGGLYERMFSLGGLMEYTDFAPQFNYTTEVGKLYATGQESEAPQIWHLPRRHNEVPETDYIFAKEKAEGKYGYWAFTRPNRLDTFDERYLVIRSGRNTTAPGTYLLADKGDKLQKDDSIIVKQIPKDSAMYYRQLFSGKDNVTRSSLHFGIFVNRRLIAVAGTTPSELQRLEGTGLFLNFIAAYTTDETVKYLLEPEGESPYLRLVLRLLLSGEFYKYLLSNVLKSLTHVNLQTLRTVAVRQDATSLTHKYLMSITSKEKLESGKYKLTYEGEFDYETTYKEVLEQFLVNDLKTL